MVFASVLCVEIVAGVSRQNILPGYLMQGISNQAKSASPVSDFLGYSGLQYDMIPLISLSLPFLTAYCKS